MELEDVEALFILPERHFEDEEVNGLVRVFETYDIHITYVTPSGEDAHGNEGLLLTPDAALADVDVASFDVLLVTGCSGSEGELSTDEVRQAVATAQEEGLVIGSVCMATRVLAGYGLFQDRQVAVPSELQIAVGDDVADVVDGDVARSGRLFTCSTGAETEEMAEELVDFLIHEREHGER